MEGDIAKKIFIKFLKEKKLMGNVLIYFFGKPMWNHILSNTKILNQEAKSADKTVNPRYKKSDLIHMLGLTHDISVGIIKPKQDLLYDAYLKWEQYINDNWNDIYNKYYKKQLMDTSF
jgi:hypothetical protein